MNPLDLLIETLCASPLARPKQLRAVKNRFAKTAGTAPVSNSVLLREFRAQVKEGRRDPNPQLERVLTLNAVRSESGIVAVTVLTKPYACPGRCVYCPTEEKAPKSYLPDEPLVMRALNNGYDPYRQTSSRLNALENTGHPTDKIELIVKGGTWSFYPAEYQADFIRRCFDAANGFGSGTLREAHERNETTHRRIIGLTVETRPDYVTPGEILRLRELGVTRVELGVQSLEERILELTVRDHGTEAVRKATNLLKEAGFKVAYHMMPNLPGAMPEDDSRSFRKLFENPSYRPDALKIYPCVVVKSAPLYSWWKEGRYQPYGDDVLTELLVELKAKVPPYVRIERVVRDIAAPVVEAGCRQNNLREEVLRRMKERGISCRCIRCREVRSHPAAEFRLVRRDYEASGGKEIFLSFEEPQTERLAALLRLRISAHCFSGEKPLFEELKGLALVRELHTYGRQLSLRQKNPEASQHLGFGKRLMAEAERIASNEFGLSKMAVIAGVGVRDYYRKLGYRLIGTYMVKQLNEPLAG